jgi:transcriptional regulator with XRE-family HTH domain
MELDDILKIIDSKLKTQEQLADEIGISKSYFNQILKNRRTPRKHVLIRLSEWAKKQTN